MVKRPVSRCDCSDLRCYPRSLSWLCHWSSAPLQLPTTTARKTPALQHSSGCSLTCVLGRVLAVGGHPRRRQALLVHLPDGQVVLIGALLRVGRAVLHALPAAGLVLVVGMVLLVLHPQALRLFHKGTLLALAQQAVEGRQGQWVSRGLAETPASRTHSLARSFHRCPPPTTPLGYSTFEISTRNVA